MSGSVPVRVGAARFAAGTNGRSLADAGHRAGLREQAERAAATPSSPVRPPAGRSPASARRPQTASPAPCGRLRNAQQCPPCSWFEPTPAQCNSLSVGSTDLGQVRSLWPSVLSVGDRPLEGFPRGRDACTPVKFCWRNRGRARLWGHAKLACFALRKTCCRKKFLLPQRILSARRASNQLLHKTRPIPSVQPVRGVGSVIVRGELGLGNTAKFSETFISQWRLIKVEAMAGIGKGGTMVLRLAQLPIIEDLRNHSAETVENLRELLASGTPAHPDPHRAGFYEVQNHSQVFYIHVSPVNGKVLLLATWRKDSEASRSANSAA